MVVPRTKLYYMAPELMREVRCWPLLLRSGDIYHYTEKTDIYAFGVVFFELLTRRYPCPSLDSTGYPLDVTMVIYQVGRGFRQNISSRDAPKKIRVQRIIIPSSSFTLPPPSQDLIWDCWQLDARKRPPFSTIWDILSKVLRKKTPIGRSPSVPTALSRSSEDLLKLTLHH
jgi:serine/threonine protein kinase